MRPLVARDHEFQIQPKLDLPPLVGSRMQHVIDAAKEEEKKQTAAEAEKPKEKVEKFTPDAMLADPRRAFLRGVFEFPFYLDVLPQWIKLAFSLAVELTLVWWLLVMLQSSFANGTAGMGLGIGAVVLAAPAMLLGCVLIAMTWAVGSAIIEETAAGLNHIENWPESLILDDLPSLIFPAVAAFLSALPGVAAESASGKLAPQIVYILPSIALFFPFVLLSILETGSVFVPFSKAVFRCVWKRPGTWIWFYLEATPIVAAAAWASWRLFLVGGWQQFCAGRRVGERGDHHLFSAAGATGIGLRESSGRMD